VPTAPRFSSLKLFWIAGTPRRLVADATLASRIGILDTDPDPRIRDAPVDTVPRG